MANTVACDIPAAARILVVDDEEEVTRALVRGLKRFGFQASGVLSGEEALQQMAQRSFDLLLTDIYMPRMRGDELQRRARQLDPDLAVILVTAINDTTCAVACLKEGAFDYVLKPASLTDITIHVNKALERRRLIIENRNHHIDLENKLAAQARRIRAMFQRSLLALNQVLEAKDEATQYHSTRVAELAYALGSRIRPGDTDFLSLLRVAAMFHDIGKVGVPESILNKPDRLTPEEWAIVQRHPVIGEAILQPLLNESRSLAMVRHHHERMDGKGYPDGLAGEAIPLGARIVAVADAFDAMTSKRAYRRGMSMEEALEILCDGAGTQWDARVVEALLAMEEEGELEVQPGSDPIEDEEAPETDNNPASITPVRTSPLPYSRLRRPIVYTAGDIDEAGVERLRSKVGGLIGQGENDYIVDMRQIGCLTAEAVQFIYLVHLRTQESGGKMALRDVPDHAMNAFREAKLDTTLIFETAPPRRPRRFSSSDRKKRLTEIMASTAP